MSASELAGWMEYHAIFPFDAERADYRMAQLCELQNQIAKGNVRKYGSWKFFMPDYLGEFKKDLQAIIDQEQINMELGWANYLDAQEKADGNQTSRPS